MVLDALDVAQGGQDTQNESLNEKWSALSLWEVPQLFNFCVFWLISRYTYGTEL